MSTLQQFFTHKYEILEPFLRAYCPDADLIVDPYAGEGHLLRLFDCLTISIDVDSAVCPDIVADSFVDIPYWLRHCVVVTNPPYSHRHVLQKQNPKLYEIVTEAGYTDLYEYALRRVISQLDFPPIFAVVPENLIASRTTKLRKELYDHIVAVQVHTSSTCEDTDQPTVCVFITPGPASGTDLWIDTSRKGRIIVGPDGMRPSLGECDNYFDFGLKDGQSEWQRDTSILLQATDGGSVDNRIKLMRVSEKFGTRHFHNKISDRAYIQVVPLVDLSESEILKLIRAFNKYVDNWRGKTHGLGLTSFRSNTSGGFRRKRIDFKLARSILNHITRAVVARRGP